MLNLFQTTSKNNIHLMKILLLIYSLVIAALLFMIAVVELSSFYIFSIILLIIILSEFVSRKLIKKTFFYKKWDFKPHIFLNFISNDKYNVQQVQISSDGFRQTNSDLLIEKENFYNLYLMGDCEFFERHLPNNETFAFKLKQKFSNITILNPSMDYYTHHHMLNRFIYDIKNSKKIDFVLSSATVNDVLVYIHHKNGEVRNDFSHWYKTFLDLEDYSYIKKIPSMFLQIILLFLRTGSYKKSLDYHAHFYDINKNFQSPSNYKIAKELFNTSNLYNYLNLLLCICKSFNIKLALSTFAYKISDFQFEPRITYVELTKKINELYRNFAKTNNLLLIDFEKEINYQENDIQNKWLFSNTGNDKRAELAAKILNDAHKELKK